jgi:uncharacterized protein with FMN-binding domain
VRPPAVVLTALTAVAVLAVGWHEGSRPNSGAVAGVHLVAPPPRSSATPPTKQTATKKAKPKTSKPTATATKKAKPKATAPPVAQRRVVDGGIASTPYGDVQVRLVVVGGKITDVQALRLTDSNGRSREISASAEPTLRQEALAAQSAQIDTVSGATYTSEGYRQSLQAAIDQAQL